MTFNENFDYIDNNFVQLFQQRPKSNSDLEFKVFIEAK